METMPHIRVMATDLAFGPLIFEHQLVLPVQQRELLEDVHVALFGYASQVGATFTAPSDVRLYVDSIDITSSFLSEIKRLVTDADAARIRQEYQASLNKWIATAETMGPAYGRDIDEEKAAVRTLLETTPQEQLTQFGDHTVGGYGILHLTCHLWSAIELPYVSLRRVLEQHHAAGGDEIDIQTARRLTVSNGPCRLFVDNWTMPKSHGSLRFQSEAVYTNALAERVERLEERFDELETWINEDLSRILEMVDTTGPIARQVRASQTAVEDAQNQIELAKTELSSQRRQLVALQTTAKDLKISVDAL